MSRQQEAGDVWSRKESDRRYRERVRHDPQRYERMLQLTKERHRRRKERLRQEAAEGR